MYTKDQEPASITLALGTSRGCRGGLPAPIPTMKEAIRTTRKVGTATVAAGTIHCFIVIPMAWTNGYATRRASVKTGPMSSGRSGGNPRSMYPCPCCAFLTISEEPPGTFEICPVCCWEDDNVQFEDPDYTGGANKVSLKQARENFRLLGAISKEFLGRVRKPLPAEVPA